jgi:hypothetical protein
MLGTVFYNHRGGICATVKVDCDLTKLAVLSGKHRTKLDKLRVDLAGDCDVPATFFAFNKPPGKCTLHVAWPVADIEPASESPRKRVRKSAAASGVKASPSGRARGYRARVRPATVAEVKTVKTAGTMHGPVRQVLEGAVFGPDSGRLVTGFFATI